MFIKCRRYDLVFLQKKLLTPWEALLLRKMAKRVVYDFDDAVYIRDHPERGDDYRSLSRYIKFLFTVKGADLVIAGNRILAGEAERLNRRVVVLPSGVPASDVPQKDYQRVNSEFILGWVGGGGNLHHLEILENVLRRLSVRYPIQMYVLSDRSLQMDGVKVKNIPWDLQTETHYIALFDAGLMPLPKNRWTEGKCAYKALQYMAASVVPVVSDVGINRDVVRDGIEGLVVREPEGFYQAIERLILDRNLCRSLGQNARKRVLKEFSLEVVGQRLADILNSI